MGALDDGLPVRGTPWRFDMNNDLRQPLTELAADAMLRVHDGRGRVIVVFEGRVWITQVNDRRDFVLGGGESFPIDRPGLTLVQAFRDSKLMVVEGGPTPLPAASTYELHQWARAQRSAAIGGALAKGLAALRSAVVSAFKRTPQPMSRRPLTPCTTGR